MTAKPGPRSRAGTSVGRLNNSVSSDRRRATVRDILGRSNRNINNLGSPGVLESKAKVEASLASAHHWASFLAASCQDCGDWLFALPIASCGLKLDDEAVRVAVGLRLGLDLCIPHQCHCGSPVDARGLRLQKNTGQDG